MSLLIIFFSACESPHAKEVDVLNEKAYAFRYRNIDSTKHYAEKSLQLADSIGVDAAESLNHLAFVSLAKMQYNKASQQLDSIEKITNNQIELLIADIQQMRLCQRQSRNKDFYKFHERATSRLKRIEDEPKVLTPHQEKRLIFAKSEINIVASTYFYYVGLTEQSVKSLEAIDPDGEIQKDTAQLLSYWYNIGAGGILSGDTPEHTAQMEFDFLMRCYLVATEHHYLLWKAQAMQALSEHLQKPAQRDRLIKNNSFDISQINVDHMPDSLLAGYLAQRAYNLFVKYGDQYQIAGADRTLAECFWQIKDYRSALICLRRAIVQNKAINQAPDLVASIREQLSLVYSAVDDKKNSDLNRNLYLDIQEQTRQDRQLEARAAQLDASSRQLNLMLLAVIVMIVVVLGLLVIFHQMRRISDRRFSLDTLLEPLDKWRQNNELQTADAQERYDEISEETNMVALHLSQNKRRNLEQRAKVQLVNSIMPIIDRMVNEINRLQKGDDTEEVRKQRYQYIAELTDSINDYNNVLTQWIQIRQGELSLKIESFPLQTLFDIVSRARMSYSIKGINLVVVPTESVVKADKTLTLFMINTMADNARKFTSEGGTVTISSTETPDYVEISVRDNGCGMTEEKLEHIFDRTYTGGHGFGLKNCNGIIEKYKKISRIFNVCTIQAESKVDEGTNIFFRLPKGIVRMVITFMILCSQLSAFGQSKHFLLRPHKSHQTDRNNVMQRRDNDSKASKFADSAYFSNIKGTYETTMRFADSCHKYLTPADTAILLDISNETAVAALALHRWDVYEKNNKVYTRLFREASADNSLPEYVRTMQKSGTNKNVAVTLLILLLAIIFPAYYFLYYRYRLNYRFCIDRINSMNKLLLTDLSDQEKLQGIGKLNDFKKFTISDEQQDNIKGIVDEIQNALQTSIDNISSQETSIELAEDNLRRLQMDNYQLHVSNSVLENCLSTLKHETMYYPSRIRHLIDGTDENLSGINELAEYYKDLYRILSLQAMRQIAPLRLDMEQTDFLFELLKKLNQGEKPKVEIAETKEAYVTLLVDMNRLRLTEEECANLFTPNTKDLNCLVCRQIVREIGEVTSLRGCGIMAETAEVGTIVRLTLPARLLEGDDPMLKIDRAKQ